MSAREFDIILFGATGFTGRLVAEYLAAKRPAKWAIAGRNADKLKALGARSGSAGPRSTAEGRREVSIEAPIVVVDALDAKACADVARRTKVVCTTVGPYTLYGGPLVAACAEAGTSYCDLTGETNFMRATIDAHDDRAKQTGARIVHTCGFDSIPSDLGTYAAKHEFMARVGQY
jgi:short subunit dehydrogenase-like uncharacterized protein